MIIVFVAFCSSFLMLLKSCLSKVILEFKEIVWILLSIIDFGQVSARSGEEAYSLVIRPHISCWR